MITYEPTYTIIYSTNDYSQPHHHMLEDFPFDNMIDAKQAIIEEDAYIYLSIIENTGRLIFYDQKE